MNATSNKADVEVLTVGKSLEEVSDLLLVLGCSRETVDVRTVVLNNCGLSLVEAVAGGGGLLLVLHEVSLFLDLAATN